MSNLTHYQEITILPDPEISTYFIWQKLYTQLHIALADIKNKHGIDSIGVAFPDYRYEERQDKNGNLKTFATLGSKLRVFAPTEQTLQTLNLNNWLERLTDYVHIKSIKPVPENVTGQVLVKRYRYKNRDKMAKEFAQHKGISMAEALAHCQAYKKPLKAYPFINQKSETTGQAYKLSICQEQVDKAQSGAFTTYGINTMTGDATVPHW